MQRWQEEGGTLVVDGDYAERLPITVTARPGRSYRLTSDGPHTIRYVGRSTYHWFICIYSEGETPLAIDGNLTIDGRDMVSMPLFVRFENVGGAARRDLFVSGLTSRNARMRNGTNSIDGRPANAYGASAMVFTGGFDHLRLRNVKAENVSRDVGAGRLGSQGSIGIAVTGNTSGTQSARHITIEDFEVTNIDSDDPANSRNRGDMDGVLVFQAAERDGTRPIIQRGVIREAAGRAIKVYALGGGGITRDLKIYRTRPGGIFGSVDVNLQHGDGLVDNIEFFYSGRANDTATVPIGFSASHARVPAFPFGTGTIRNVTIHDTTGKPKHALIGLQYNLPNDTSARRYAISSLTDEGSARYLFLPGALGTFQPAQISMSNISVRLTTSMFASDDSNQNLRLSTEHVTNRVGQPVPVKTYYDGRVALPQHRVSLGAVAAVRGFTQ